jgi:hypothetical protein
MNYRTGRDWNLCRFPTGCALFCALSYMTTINILTKNDYGVVDALTAYQLDKMSDFC